MAELEIRRLARYELDAGAEVVGRAFRDNPTSLVVYGSDADHRERCQRRFFAAVLPRQKEPALSAWRDGQLVGVLGLEPPGSCHPTFREQLLLAPRLVLIGRPGETWRGMRYFQTLHRHDLAEPHWHLGPVAVEPVLQGTGVGSRMMEAFCESIGGGRVVAYLETEKPENVRFYERFGFETIKRIEYLGVPQWLMRRPSAA